jgi:ribosomal protein S27AE
MGTQVGAKMICPECGAEMNFHAEKLIYSQSAPDSGAALEGQVEEMHTCPRCGGSEARRQQAQS